MTPPEVETVIRRTISELYLMREAAVPVRNYLDQLTKAIDARQWRFIHLTVPLRGEYQRRGKTLDASITFVPRELESLKKEIADVFSALTRTEEAIASAIDFLTGELK